MIQFRIIKASLIATLLGIAPLTSALAQPECVLKVGEFVSIDGAVTVQRGSGNGWVAAHLASALCEGDTIRVGDRSRAAVSLINDAVLRIDQNTTMRLLDITDQETERSWLDVVRGAFQSFIRKPRFLSVTTPYLNGSIEGTEFLVRVDDTAADITVFEGVVLAANEKGQLELNPGESARAGADQAPQRRILVRSRDLVQWGLHYLPLLLLTETESSALRQAAACAAKGDTVCAFGALDEVPADQRDAQFYQLRAAVQLAVGRVDAAKADIAQILSRDADSGQAYALRSVIAVALNEKAAALVDARRSVELNPGSTAVRIALSYALQADLQLEAARDTLSQAVEQQPEQALAWARLAELRLSLGNRRGAIHAA